MKKTLLILLTAIALVFAACQSKPATDNAKTNEAGYKEMKGADLEAIEQDNKEKEKVLVVDVRAKEEYDAGHVKHAINMPIDTFEADLAKLDAYKEFPVITICNSGKKSGQAAEILVKNGFKDVTNAEGVKSFEYQLVTFGSILPEDFKAVFGTDVTIIDARDAKDYDEAHIVNAINIPSDKVDELIGSVPNDKPVYAHCYSGNKSAAICQKLTEMGYKNVYNSLYGTKEYEYELVK